MTPRPTEAGPEPAARLYDTSGIPDTPEYWEALSKRVSDSVARQRARHWIAGSGISLVAAASLAIAAALLLIITEAVMPDRQSADGLLIALAPAEWVGRSLSAGDGPPSVGELLVARSRDVERAK